MEKETIWTLEIRTGKGGGHIPHIVVYGYCLVRILLSWPEEVVKNMLTAKVTK